ncbi:MAG: chalcone isomerase family protein [Gammaproteobacteria bacterium]|nr:chalcone isomerase family protein [Gammaproteobacteria bacterium]
MNRSILALFLTVALMASGLVSAKSVSGVEIPDTLTVAGQELVLNGAGLRKKLFIKLYVGGLYLPQPSSDAEGIIAEAGPMAISMHIKSDLLTKKKLLAALEDGMKNSTGGNTAPIQTELDQLKSLFKDSVRPGDVIVLAFDGVGTDVILNGESLDVIDGLPFKQALFGVWLSAKPAQASLKKAMLGGQ